MTRNYVNKEKTSVKYHQLSRHDDSFIDAQFQRSSPKVPYKAILLAVVLFIVGSLLIIFGSLLMAGYFDNKYADRTWPVLILGIIMFIPGIYHVRIAYYAWNGYTGYSFEDIPEFE